MKRFFVVMVLASLACAGALQAQAPAGLAAEVKQSYNRVKNNILKTADKMPAENFGFKPTPDVRSFAEVLGHIYDSQMRACAAIAGDEKKGNAAGKTSKADVMAALNDSFAECDKAVDSLTDASATEMVKVGSGERSRLGVLYGIISHDNEQYGIMTVHLRLKGIVPPASDRSAGR